jgi:hypothetical protein
MKKGKEAKDQKVEASKQKEARVCCSGYSRSR